MITALISNRKLLKLIWDETAADVNQMFGYSSRCFLLKNTVWIIGELKKRGRRQEVTQNQSVNGSVVVNRLKSSGQFLRKMFLYICFQMLRIL